MRPLLPHLSSLLPVARPAAPRILIVNGHPDSRPERFCAAVCTAYGEGARAGGCLTRRMDVGARGRLLDGSDTVPGMQSEVAQMLEGIWWADRLFIAYPMWLDGPPPTLQCLFEVLAQRRLSGKSSPCVADLPSADKEARIVVTTGLPALLYRAKIDGAATPAGFRLAPTTYIGSVDSISPGGRARWLENMYALGRHERRNRRRGLCPRVVS